MPLRSSLVLCSAISLASASAALAAPAGGRSSSKDKPAAAAPAPAPTPAPAAPIVAPAPVLPTPPRWPPRKGPRIAIDEFRVDGDDVPPALALQLLDGFVLGLVRQGLQVVDPDDVKRRLAPAPELTGCDTSPCLKRKGQLLGVPFVSRVKIDVVGNSYKMLVRVYRTEGAAPAVLPVDTRSRFCDVCTIAEAREVMIKLADGVDLPREEVVPPPLSPPPPAPRPSLLVPALVTAAGVAAIVGGGLLLAGSDRDDKTGNALSGALMGAGAFATTFGIYLVIDRSVARPPSAAVTIGTTF